MQQNMADACEDGLPANTSQRPDLEKLVYSGKNATAIRCQRCPSLILSPGQARFVRKQLFLPHMKKKSQEQKPDDGEMLDDCWIVNDMFTFENVGFSNSVGTLKYLMCADCEVGPIGLQDLNDRTSIYVALDRVQHDK